jgi:DNA-binding SARP family transcriptional activator
VALSYVALATLRPAESDELLDLARSTGAGQDVLTDAVMSWPWLGHAPPARAGPDTDVELTCFRSFAVRIGGTDWQPSGVRPRARTLLRLLALRCGESVHRDQLAASLWPAMAEDTAMHNLQVAISSLRKVCTGPALAIERDGDSYRLVLGGGARSDVQHFDAHLSAAVRARGSGDLSGVATRLRAALDYYAGDLLPEDGAAEWVLAHRERYRTMAVGAAAALAELELDRGELAAAVTAAERGVDIDRFHDGCWRALIRAHERRGDLAAAEQARAGYRTVLDSLGLE